MTHATAYTCDSQICGKTISGDGRNWMLIVQTQQIARDPKSTPRHNQHLSLAQRHFCGPDCLAHWAGKFAVEDKEAQKAFEEVQAAQVRAKEAGDKLPAS